MSKTSTGKIDPRRIRRESLPRVADDVLARHRAPGDAICDVSDALDEFGLRGVVAGSRLVSTIPGARTGRHRADLRNVLRQDNPMVAASRKDNRMADFECHNLAEPGDALKSKWCGRFWSELAFSSATIGVLFESATERHF